MAGPVRFTDAHGNQLTTPAHIMFELVMALVSEPVACQPENIVRNLQTGFDKAPKKGKQVWMRLQQYFEVTVGKTWVGQDLTDEEVPITFDEQRHVGFEWDSFVGLRHIENVTRSRVKPALNALISDFDNYAMDCIGDTINRWHGTIGQFPGEGDAAAYSAYRTYATGAAQLREVGVPMPLNAICSPLEHLDLVVDSMALFNPRGQIGANYMSGQFSGGTNGASAGGINNWFESAYSYRMKLGTLTAAVPLVAGAGQTGGELVTDGWPADTKVLLRGNKIGFEAGAGQRYETHQQPPHPSNGRKVTYTVLEDVTASAAGAATIKIWPKMIPTGQGQNMTAALPDNAPITVMGKESGDFADISGKTFRMGCVFNRRQGVLVTGELPVYRGKDLSMRMSAPGVGTSVRVERDKETRTDEVITRIDLVRGRGDQGTGRPLGYVVPGPEVAAA